MNTIESRLDGLRSIMKDAGISAVIVPHVDPHQSEYIANHWQARRYLSGFTGSAGSLLITDDKALLWTDSRYFLQAAQQLNATPFSLMKDGLPDTPSISRYITNNIPAGSVVGIDGFLFTKKAVDNLKKELSAHQIVLVTDFSPIDAIWPDRPPLPKDKVFIHELKYAGESAASKIRTILMAAEKAGAESVLITALDEIAWILNIRSTDVPCNPVATSFLYLSPSGSVLFIDPAKLTDKVCAHLTDAGVSVAPYGNIISFLSHTRETKILADPTRTANILWNAIENKAVCGESPASMLKACKNSTQIAGIRSAMERDGAALVNAFMEIESRISSGDTVTELTIAEILRRHRSMQSLFFDISFDTIAGYGPHGAIVHYSAKPETDATLARQGLLLIDSGAQYLDGTTDITRTVSLGNPSLQEKSDFTLVLKGNIALDSAVFPTGTRGTQLDVLAHQYLWKHGLNYLHGTGHGVGHFLNVHEGPQSIRMNEMPAHLQPGMVTSDEPGVYREGSHGIRCENLVLTVPAFTTEFGSFLKFETLTLFPFDLNLIDLDLMTKEEILWLNNYHREVYRRLSPLLSEEGRRWLLNKTRQL